MTYCVCGLMSSLYVDCCVSGLMCCVMLSFVEQKMDALESSTHRGSGAVKESAPILGAYFCFTIVT